MKSSRRRKKNSAEEIRLFCPNCGQKAENKQTKYGVRSRCGPCGLWSWDGKPLVSEDVHKARMAAHDVFDAVWKRAEEAYPGVEDPATIKKLRRIARNRGYAMLSYLTGLPESDCHMGGQEDVAKLRQIEAAAKELSPEGIRAWWKKEGKALAAKH